MSILLISNKWDVSIDYVVGELRRMGEEYLRINTEDLVAIGASAQFPGFSFRFHKNGSEDLAKSLKSVLFRRPGKPFEFDGRNRPAEPTLKFITDQWHSLLAGLRSIPDVLWINSPLKNSHAEAKIGQLRAAEQIGLDVPRTCITSDKRTLANFAEGCGALIAKSLYAPLIQEPDQEFFIFSNRIGGVSEIDSKEMELAPTIFQEEISGKTDYRVTVIGEHHFAAQIVASDGSVLDWRRAKNRVRLKRAEIPDDVAEKCVRLVSGLGLIFGAIDLVKRGDTYYFLEINPNGEWGWLQRQLDLPIAQTLAECLVRRRG